MKIITSSQEQMKTDTTVEKTDTTVENSKKANKINNLKTDTTVEAKKSKTDTPYRDKLIRYPDNMSSVMIGEISELIDSFLRTYPDYRFVDRLPGYVLRYLGAIREQLLKQAYYRNGVSMNFSLQRARDYCNIISVNNKRVSLWAVFHEVCPIVQVLEEGSNMSGVVSKVMISDKYMELLIKSADASEIVSSWFCNCDDDSDIEYIPVDMDSLNHYIMATEQDIKSATNTNYIAKLQRGLLQAGQVKVVAQHLVDTGVCLVPSWPHIAKRSPYGRKYYTGLSLHNCNREVRRAAIGGHFQYDLETAVYAIKLMLVENIYAELGQSMYGEFVNTKEYIDFKSPIRRRLSKHITKYPDPLKIVKTAMTAVGFGARLQNSSWTDEQGIHFGSLTTIIRDAEDRARFINDPWVVEFVREQEHMSEIIATYWKTDVEMAERMKLAPNMLTPTGKFRNNQVVCFMFQQMEQQIMDAVFMDQPVLIRIHDACISKTPLDMSVINNRLQAISSYLSVEKEHTGGYYRECNDAELVGHVNRIENEEQQVAKLNSKPVHYPGVRAVSKVTKQSETWIGNYGPGQYEAELDPFLDELNIN
jgi:hypothetical protein